MCPVHSGLVFGIQERTYYHLFIAPLLTDEYCSWSVFLVLYFFSEGFVPSSDPHWTWESALVFQILCDIGAHIPEFNSEMVKPNAFDLITCEDLWHALFRNYLVKRSWIKCLLSPFFSSDLAIFSETRSPPAQRILLNRSISTRVMSYVTAVQPIGRSWCHIPFAFIIYRECPSQDPQGKCQHPQRNLPLKDSMGILKRKSSMHSPGILS